MASIQTIQGTLKVTYGILPVATGLDKFTHILTRWEDYLGRAKNIIPFDPVLFMKGVGVIEIIAGLLVFLRPLAGAYVVMIWLICIALQLIINTYYWDVAVRDLVIAIGAHVFAQLTRVRRQTA